MKTKQVVKNTRSRYSAEFLPIIQGQQSFQRVEKLVGNAVDGTPLPETQSCIEVVPVELLPLDVDVEDALHRVALIAVVVYQFTSSDFGAFLSHVEAMERAMRISLTAS